MEAAGDFVPAEARGTSSAVGTCSRSRSAPVPVLPTFSCDECEAVYNKPRALRSHQMRAHQRRREARRYVLGSISPVCKAELLVETEGRPASGGGSEAVRLGMEVWSARAVFG